MRLHKEPSVLQKKQIANLVTLRIIYMEETKIDESRS